MITQAYQKAESKPVRVMLRLYTLMLLCSAAISPLALTIFNSSFVKYWLAAVLFELCLYPTYRYFKYSESGVPTLPLLSLAYAFQFALPVFTHEPVMPVINSFVELDDAKVQYALLMAIAGMVFLQAGFYLIRAKGVIRSLPTARLRLNTRKALLFCIGIFAFSFLLRVGESLIIERVGVSINSIIGLLQNQILVAIAILGWLVYSNRGGRWHKVLLWTIVAVAMVRGSATSMMESMLLPVMVLFTTKWIYTRRLPVFGFIAVAALMIFLSPVKGNFRTTVGMENESETQSSASERSLQWINQAYLFWIESLSGARTLTESTSDITSRTDLIHQFAYIYSLTPSVVPFQNGETYKYFAVALIPRVIWPEKPVANSSNNFFAISYGISTETGVETSTFGVSLIGEGYMNFGFAGVLMAMAVQGLILSALEQIFGGIKSGAGGIAIFVATFVYFLNGIGSSAEIMFGGIIQNLVCSAILLWWIRERVVERNPKLRQRTALAQQV